MPRDPVEAQAKGRASPAHGPYGCPAHPEPVEACPEPVEACPELVEGGGTPSRPRWSPGVVGALRETGAPPRSCLRLPAALVVGLAEEGLDAGRPSVGPQRDEGEEGS